MHHQLQWFYSINCEDDMCVTDVNVFIPLLSWQLSKGTKKLTLNLSEDNWSPGWDLKLIPTVYEGGMYNMVSTCLSGIHACASIQEHTHR
jgi:hypothetical protein